jgi:hypothetical protein
VSRTLVLSPFFLFCLTLAWANALVLPKRLDLLQYYIDKDCSIQTSISTDNFVSSTTIISPQEPVKSLTNRWSYGVTPLATPLPNQSSLPVSGVPVEQASLLSVPFKLRFTDGLSSGLPGHSGQSAVRSHSQNSLSKKVNSSWGFFIEVTVLLGDEMYRVERR